MSIKKVIEVFYDGVWNDITSDVVSDIDIVLGFSDDNPNNRIANIGSMSFFINNSSGNYTPSNSNPFRKGNKVQLTIIYTDDQTQTYDDLTDVKFYGFIKEIEVNVGTWGDKRIRVTAVDLFDIAANYVLNTPPNLATSQTIDQAVTTLVALLPTDVYDTNYDTGVNTFTTVFDNIRAKTTVYKELNSLVMSEMGYIYLKDGGRTLRVENAHARNGYRDGYGTDSEPFVADTVFGDELLLLEDGGKLLLETGFDLIINSSDYYYLYRSSYANTYTDLDVRNGYKIINDVTFRTHPKRKDNSTVILYTLDNPIPLPSLKTTNIKINYTDPSTGGKAIAASGIQNLVATTDYLANTSSDGTGSNITANLTITMTKGVSATNLAIYNSNNSGYLTKLELHGYGIYPYNPLETNLVNVDSNSNYGNNPILIDQPYIDTLNQQYPKIILDEYKDVENDVLKMRVMSYDNINSDIINFFDIDIGTLISIDNTNPAITDYFYVMGIKYKITLGQVIYSEYLLQKRSSIKSTGLTPIAVEFGGTGSGDAINFGYLPHAANQSQRSVSFWLYLDSDPASTTRYGIMGFGDYWRISVKNTRQMELVQINQGVGNNPGIWRTPVSGVPLSDWTHFAVTYDNSSVANNPVIWQDGVSQTLTEVGTPVGTPSSETNLDFVVGNTHYYGNDYEYPLDGKLKYMRVYNRILTSGEIQSLAGFSLGEPDVVTSGLVIQPLNCKTTRYSDFVNYVLDENKNVIDNTYYYRGIANGNPFGRSVT